MQHVFVNLPVTDLPRARQFYGALGFSFDERFSDDTAACVVVSENIYFMILTREKFATFTPGTVKATSCMALTSTFVRAKRLPCWAVMALARPRPSVRSWGS